MLRLIWSSLLTLPIAAQFPGLTLPPSGNNQKAGVAQFIGPVKVTIDYSSPAVHGPGSPAGGPNVDRRGKIWGALVPYGLTDLGFGTSKQAPWRAGANENTVFAVSEPVLIEGQPLAAGRYGFHIIVEPAEWTLIFSRNSTSWGSFFYDPAEDALRVKVKPRKHDYREYLTYEFVDRKPEEATAELQWEDLAVSWRIQVPKANDIYLSRLREELRTNTGFNHLAWVNAVQYCLQTNTNYEEALKWADYAISGPFIGQTNFNTLSTKAQVLRRLNRTADAKVFMDQAIELPGTTVFEIHQYGRQLLNAKQNEAALAVFQLNAKRFGEAWPTHVGLARGYAAVGDKAKALEHAKKAQPQAPDTLNRQGIEALIQSLSQ